MTRPSINWLPLVLLTALAALTLWIERSTQEYETTRRSTSRGIDFWAETFVMHRFGTDGQLLNVLRGKKMTHESSDDSSKIASPHLTYAGKSPTIIVAREAELSSKGEQVDLIGNVHINRTAKVANKAAQGSPIHIRSEHMTIFPDTERATGHTSVRIERRRDVITGASFETDGKTGVSVVRGRVHATIHPNDS